MNVVLLALKIQMMGKGVNSAVYVGFFNVHKIMMYLHYLVKDTRRALNQLHSVFSQAETTFQLSVKELLSLLFETLECFLTNCCGLLQNQ